MQCEAQELQKNMTEVETQVVSGISFVTGKLVGKEVVLAVCSEGKVNAALCAEAMVLRYQPSLLLNTGVAGSLSPSLKVPDVAIATAVGEHDSDISPLGYQKGEVIIRDVPYRLFEADKKVVQALLAASASVGVHAEAGTIVSGDQFIADPVKKQELIDRYDGAVACEMEGGAIGHVAFVNHIPFGIIRAISDGAEDENAYDPLRAAAISVAITLKFLKNATED